MRSLALLVATPGGHIEELFELVPRLDRVADDRVWVTAKTPQTSRLLQGHRTHWVRPVGARQGVRAASTVPGAIAMMLRYRPGIVLSTGAALAVPYLVTARGLGIETHYIESATRLVRPSVTGRLMERTPGVHLHDQGFTEARRGWRTLGSVFDAYAPGPERDIEVRRVVVTVGTERFPFPRALETVAGVLPTDVDALIQTGHTTPSPLLPQARPWVPADEFGKAIERADLVITHAGVGSVLTALRSGRHPVVIPRISSRGEHVDDHQAELARVLGDRGLATVIWPGDDLGPALQAAARRTTVRLCIPEVLLSLRPRS